MWSTVEVGIGICTGCIATLRPLLAKARTKTSRLSTARLLRKSSAGTFSGSTKRNTMAEDADIKGRPDTVVMHKAVIGGKPQVAAPARAPRQPTQLEPASGGSWAHGERVLTHGEAPG